MPKYMLVSFKTCPWVQRSAIVFREKNTEFELRHIAVSYTHLTLPTVYSV